MHAWYSPCLVLPLSSLAFTTAAAAVLDRVVCITLQCWPRGLHHAAVLDRVVCITLLDVMC